MDTPGFMSSHCWAASPKPCPGPLWHLTPSWRSPTEPPHTRPETLHIPMLPLSCHCLHHQTLPACPSHPSRMGQWVTATTGNALPKYPPKQISPGWQTVGCLMPTKAAPSAGQGRENKMLLSWDKNGERPFSSYCHGWKKLSLRKMMEFITNRIGRMMRSLFWSWLASVPSDTGEASGSCSKKPLLWLPHYPKCNTLLRSFPNWKYCWNTSVLVEENFLFW